MVRMFKRLWQEQSGQDSEEYALTIALIVLLVPFGALYLRFGERDWEQHEGRRERYRRLY
jgi:hypothetical protein